MCGGHRCVDREPGTSTRPSTSLGESNDGDHSCGGDEGLSGEDLSIRRRARTTLRAPQSLGRRSPSRRSCACNPGASTDETRLDSFGGVDFAKFQIRLVGIREVPQTDPQCLQSDCCGVVWKSRSDTRPDSMSSRGLPSSRYRVQVAVSRIPLAPSGDRRDLDDSRRILARHRIP